jgi:hypothetical protein
VAEANPTQHAPGRRAPAHLGLASVAPATLLAIAFCASVPYLTHRYGAADPAAGYLPFGPLVLLAIACWAAAPLARRLWGSSDRLIRAALLFYCLTVGLGGFTTQFTVLQIPQIVTSLRYFATPQNHFEDEAIPAVADTLLITNEVAARGFYEGARIGGIPWALWYGPLLRWGALAFIYLVTAFAMLAMFRRRWVHHERLAFPLAEIPLFVAGRGQFGMTRDSPAVRRNLLIIGIAIVMVVHSVNALNRYIPSIPQIPLKFSFTPLFENPPFDVLRGASWATAWVNIPLIGIAYLMPSAMALGVFGFFLLMLAVMVISRFLGDPTLGPLQFHRWGSQKDHQAGAYIGLLLFTIWASRTDIARMVRDLWHQIAGRSDGDEHPDRWYLVAFILGMLALCWWSVSAGISFWVALTFMLATLSLTFGFALLTAQTGLPTLQVDNLPAQFLTAFVPASSIGLRNMSLIGFYNTMFSWYKRHALQPCVIQSIKIADNEGIPDRTFVTTLLLAGASLIAVNMLSLLHLSYNEGLMLRTATRWHLHSGGMGSPYYGILWAQRMIAQENPYPAWHWMVMGAVSMWVFQGLYRRFVWWPVHPLGMLIPCGWQITAQWFSVLMGWAIGRLIAKYAGPRTYLTLRPVFLGLVVGGAAAGALWMVVDAIRGLHV